MSDRIDEQIRSVFVELVEAAPPAQPYSHVEARRRGSGIGFKAGIARLSAVAAAVLFVGLVGVWVAQSVGTDGVLDFGAPTDQEIPEGAIPLPGDHLAAQLLREGAGYDEFAAVSFMCSRGGTRVGPSVLCLLDDADAMAIVPLTMPAGVEANIEGTAIEAPVVIPLPGVSSEGALPDVDEVYAVPHKGEGSFGVEFEGFRLYGRDVGDEGDEPQSEGVIDIPEDHIALDVLEGDASLVEVRDRSVELQLRYWQCGVGEEMRQCVFWDDDVVVVMPYSVPDDAIATLTSPSLEERLHMEVEEGTPFAIRHEEGVFAMWYERDGEYLGSVSSEFPNPDGG